MKLFCWLLVVIGLAVGPQAALGQSEFPYNTDLGRESLLIGTGLLTTGVSISLNRRIVPLTTQDIDVLDVLSIPKFDRYATRYYSHRAHQISNYSALASMAMPVALLFDRKNRSHTGTLGLIMLEGAILNFGLTSLTKTTFHRTRPYVFNQNVEIDRKLRLGARSSFFSGHTSTSAYFSFTGAQMFSDLYPDSKMKPVVWATAAILPAITGYHRMRAGKHYLSDVIIGYTVGAVIGLLIPHLHR